MYINIKLLSYYQRALVILLSYYYFIPARASLVERRGLILHYPILVLNKTYIIIYIS